MKSARLACLFLFLAAPMFSQTWNTARFSGSATPRAATSATSSQMTGLSFAPAAIHGTGGNDPLSVAVADLNGDGKPDIVVANPGCGPGCRNGGTVGVLLRKGGAFQNPVSYLVGGSDALSVAVADVNGDGKADILAGIDCGDSECTHSAVVVLLGNGDGTFQTAVTYNSGGYLGASVVVADVNGDGKPDLVVASPCTVTTNTDCNNHSVNGTVGVLLGNGDGTFQTAMTYDSGGVSTHSVKVADVNGDGKPDVVLVNCSPDQDCGSEDGSVGVLLGNSDGTFQAAVGYDSGGQYGSAVAVADVNGDGKLDLVAVNLCAIASNCTGGTVGVLLGNGDGTFQPTVVDSSVGFVPNSIAVSDVNGDGKVDLVVARQCATTACADGAVAVLLGNGDGTFGAAIDFGSGGKDSTSLAVADVNGDGKPDLVVTNEESNSVNVLFNTSITPTATALVSSLNPSNFAQPVTFTATLTAQPGFYKGKPTGTVSFFDTATGINLGSSALANGAVATLRTSTLGPSTHSIVATYSGDPNFISSASPALAQVVLGAAAQISPTSLAFGSLTVATSSTSQSITLKNTGDVPLTFNSITITGANPTSFSQTNNCTPSIAGGATCIISVTFNPKIAGALSAAVTFSDNAPSKVQKVPLIGVGVLPAVTISLTSLDFPRQVIDTTSGAKTVTLTNSGLGILNISSVVATGPFAETNTCGSTVNSGDSCTISVTFLPTTIGALTGAVTVTDNAASKTQALALTGIGTAVQITPLSVNFGNQPVGTTSLAKTITLSNKSHATVKITGITIVGANAGDFSETNTCGTSVASGASCFIKVKFKPSATGARAAAVSISDNGGGSPQKVSSAGSGT
jgi:hypothetical protein